VDVVVGAHQYTYGGHYTITTTLYSQPGWIESNGSTVAPSPTATSSANVTGAAATGVAISSDTSETFNGVVAHYSGLGVTSLDGWTATIDWGNYGETVGILAMNASGGIDVSGSNKYAWAGSYDVTVTLNRPANDASGAAPALPVYDLATVTGTAPPPTVGISYYEPISVNFGGNTFTATSTAVTVSPAAKNFNYVAVPRGASNPSVASNVRTTDKSIKAAVNERFQGAVGVLRGVMSRVRKLVDLTGTIDWGDGSSSTATFKRLGRRTVAIEGSHLYSSASTYPIIVTAEQAPFADGNPTTGNSVPLPAIGATASVAARSPQRTGAGHDLVISATAGNSFAATLASLDLPALPPGAARGATIHWGDGSHSAGTIISTNAAYAITGSHVYHSRGQFAVSIDVWQKSHGKTERIARSNAKAIVTKP
jgi:hypothetical protein